MTKPPPIARAVDLPDLDAHTDVEIVADNLAAAQGLYFAAMFEQLKVFAVVDKLVDLFARGQLPLGRGNAGSTLYNFWKKVPSRLTEIERRNLYLRTFGFPGGDSSAGTPNTEFAGLWIRFVSSVSAFARKLTVGDLIRNQDDIRTSASDLATNLSLHGYGIAYFASIELQEQIREIIGLLSDDEIKTAYASKDVWEVIDRVASLELGGAANGAMYHAMAAAGSTIIKWLAANSPQLTGVTEDQEATTGPTDRELVNACDSWIAAASILNEKEM